MNRRYGSAGPTNATAGARWLLAAAFALLIPGGQVAARQHPVPPVDHTNVERANQQDMTQRELKLRGVAGPAAKTTDPKRLEAITAQLEEDFKRILTLHNEIAVATRGNKALDYQFVSDAATEIKKRAARLQSTLKLTNGESQPNQEKRAKFDDSQVKDALVTLCTYIESFVSNPVIETPGTVDARQSARADSDLSSIVELSGSIRKSAEKMIKNTR